MLSIRRPRLGLTAARLARGRFTASSARQTRQRGGRTARMVGRILHAAQRDRMGMVLPDMPEEQAKIETARHLLRGGKPHEMVLKWRVRLGI